MPAYIGVNGKAKQIYKVYQGDKNGIAHLIWAPPGVYKPASDFSYPQFGSTARALMNGNGQGSASTKHHCHFFANESSDLTNTHKYYAEVDTYDEDLVLTNPQSPFYLYNNWLDNFNCDSGAGTVYDDDGNSFAIFAYGNCKVTDDALMINDDCTAMSLYGEGYRGVFGSYYDDTSSTCFASGVTTHNFIVAGGYLKNSVNAYSNHVYVVSCDGTPTADPCTLTTARAECTCVSINGAFIVVGGYSKATSAPPIEIITDELTISAGSGYTDRTNMCSTTIPNRFSILGCGDSRDDLSTIIIDKSFTVSTGPLLSTMRRQATALNVGDYAIFAGGRNISNKYGIDTVDVIDANLTRTNPENMLSQIVFGEIPGKVGKWGILYGGITHDGSNYQWNENNPEVFYSFE